MCICSENDTKGKKPVLTWERRLPDGTYVPYDPSPGITKNTEELIVITSCPDGITNRANELDVNYKPIVVTEVD